ncbi:sulfotransferase family 2 domain-containing protein [Neptunomonas concharum]|uniref:Sulfotransferase family protein n=1 Tax=Neptunomonas concharum TaxID=1031538 RepID=A0A5P1R8H3_9GAMM|nr:sulfotransferase family 2 domain-containing protein [Neptunomonas concharum]QEQ95873.1 hypothetical protein F0U83_03665 [Neptunomonas concharum]
MQKLHFLHIGKTGGTAIKHALSQLQSNTVEVILHSHQTSIKDIPEGENFILSVRNPIQRFISAFYSRKRKGRPKYNNEWNSVEVQVFTTFETPNDLAEALASINDTPEKKLAITAMQQIEHFKTMEKWYIDINLFEERKTDLYHVCHQENLFSDFEELKIKLKSPYIALPEDDINAHRNPKDINKYISCKGEKALKSWYKKDLDFISHLKKNF